MNNAIRVAQEVEEAVLFHPSQTIRLNGRRNTFCCEATWQTLGKPTLQPVTIQYQVAEGSPLPVVGQFQSTASIDRKSPDVTFPVSCAESTATIEHVTTSGPENSLYMRHVLIMWRVKRFFTGHTV